MPATTKHTDAIILGALVLGGLAAVVIYDQKVASSNEVFVGLSDENVTQEIESPQQVNPLVSQETSAEDEVKKQQRSTSTASGPPAAFEKGLVHLGAGASLGGKRPLPDDNDWNQRVDQLPTDPMSDRLISNIGEGENLHPDFGAGKWDGAPIGIPYVVVSGEQPAAPILYTAYGDQSDPGPFPIPSGAPIEGHPNTDGDRHLIVVDRDNWKLYELFRAFEIGNGQLWRAESGAVFDLNQHPSRPVGWTSADAAGLPIFPGLVRYDEVVEQEEIQHALRFTVNNTRRAFVAPATHWASSSSDPALPPMGMRVRLKADYDISSFPAEAKVILTCLKRYGMILADNGGDWYISGTPDSRWNDEAIHAIKKIKGRDLEVVLMGEITSD